jgi:DNA repair protein RadA/Sms
VAPAAEVTALGDVAAAEMERTSSGVEEFDRVLGGGLVDGGVVLIGGDPGIGKSTLLLQSLAAMAGRSRVLYVSGEESVGQVALRARRLGIDAAAVPGLQIASEVDLDRIIAAIERERPRVVVIDSIQTLYCAQLGSAPGSVSQVRECAAALTRLAKQSGVGLILVGHVTKEGALAGPRVLEHMVDTVLYFEGGAAHPYRLLRTHKNRFGSASEIGVFEMRSTGLEEVPNPSALFLAERATETAGSAVTATLSGTRTLLVEVQALVAPSGYGTARRTALGLDPARLALLAAVLEKKVGMDLVGCDLFVNVAGGLTLDDPAADLATVAALASSFRNRALDARTLVVGEVGLAGEVRAVAQAEARLGEAARLGFRRALLPEGNARKLGPVGIEVVGVETVVEALEVLLDAPGGS